MIMTTTSMTIRYSKMTTPNRWPELLQPSLVLLQQQRCRLPPQWLLKQMTTMCCSLRLQSMSIQQHRHLRPLFLPLVRLTRRRQSLNRLLSRTRRQQQILMLHNRRWRRFHLIHLRQFQPRHLSTILKFRKKRRCRVIRSPCSNLLLLRRLNVIMTMARASVTGKLRLNLAVHPLISVRRYLMPRRLPALPLRLPSRPVWLRQGSLRHLQLLIPLCLLSVL